VRAKTRNCTVQVHDMQESCTMSFSALLNNISRVAINKRHAEILHSPSAQIPQHGIQTSCRWGSTYSRPWH